MEDQSVISEPYGAVTNALKAPSKRRGWVWWLLGVLIVLLFLVWQFASGIAEARELSGDAVREFHRQLNAEKYEDIYSEADGNFRAAMKQEELTKLLRAVHKKLGSAKVNSEGLITVNLSANTNGKFVVTKYKTPFDRATAVETFTWVKSDGALKLYSYNIQSNALITE